MSKMQPPLLIANWKMYGTRQRLKDWLQSFSHSVIAEQVLMPPSVLLPIAQQNCPVDLVLGAQTLGPAREGACTGEVSAEMLLESGCRYVLVGHSERRNDCGETDHSTALRVSAAVAGGLCPVLCVGESAVERRDGLTTKVVTRQLSAGLSELKTVVDSPGLVLAYEPVWAIGTGQVPSIEQIEAVHTELNQHARTILGESCRLRVIYGGSVDRHNAVTLLTSSVVDGLLVGRASLDAEDWLELVNSLHNIDR